MNVLKQQVSRTKPQTKPQKAAPGFHLIAQQQRPVVERSSHIRMLWTKCLLPYGLRPLVQRLRFIVLALCRSRPFTSDVQISCYAPSPNITSRRRPLVHSEESLVAYARALIDPPTCAADRRDQGVHQGTIFQTFRSGFHFQYHCYLCVLRGIR